MSQKYLRRRKNSSSRQNIAYLILLILLIGFFATVGLKFVLDTSIFIAGIDKPLKIDPDNVSSNDILFEPKLYNLPDATNSAELSIEGNAPQKTDIAVFVNSIEEKNPDQNEDGDFEASIPLKKGENKIYVKVTTKDKKESKKSRIYTVYYLHDKPDVIIETPTDGHIATSQDVRVSGTVSALSSVKVNGAPAVLSSDGRFSHSVQLSEGSNTIRVLATDIAGNESLTEINVTYEKD